MANKLFVGNLSFSSTNDDLRSLFERAGSCESASIVTDRATGRSRGFGFGEMASPEEAQRAIEMLNGVELAGRRLNVSEAHGRGASGGVERRI
jgi:RNA recognition motif-containing protein